MDDLFEFKHSVIITNTLLISLENKIKWNIFHNPKNKESGNRFEKYYKSNTIKEYFENGGTKKDLRYDQEKGYIEIENIPRSSIDLKYSN